MRSIMEEQIATQSAGQVGTLLQLLASSNSLQTVVAILIVGLVAIAAVYKRFWNWSRKQKISYSRPLLAEFIRRATLPFLALALITSINFYVQVFELFDNPIEMLESLEHELTPAETLAKILNSMNILVIVFTVGHIITLILEKYEKIKQEKEDFKAWREMGGFKDDVDDLFHKCYRWVPPRTPPEDIEQEKFDELLKTAEGLSYLEKFITTTGSRIGSYEKLVKDPFALWKKSEQQKYEKYYNDCISGNNNSGRVLLPGKIPDEIYEIDVWKEEKRFSGYEPIIPGGKPPGYADKKREGLPKPFRNFIPMAMLGIAFIGIVAWWGVDLLVLATASGGIAVGVGFALKETFENYFAYITIRKDKIFMEGDRIALSSGYNGFVHNVTSRVTYIRHPLNESIAIVPTRQLVMTEIINYTKEFAIVPAIVEVGVSYLNDPKQVAAILMKCGMRALEEVKDSKGRHIAVQSKCPYLEFNRPSCGCDRQFVLDLDQPAVRFNNFNDSALDFSLRVFVRDYGSQFIMKSDLRMIIYEEFKKYDVRIPWPIRTVYQGDEKRESEEISRFDKERNRLVDEFGLGNKLKEDRDAST
jgi:potassium-dependent mechanosensitive channel